MKKPMLAIILISLVFVSGCTKTEQDKPSNQERVDRFYYLNNISGFISDSSIVIVDKQTRVCYLFHDSGYSGGLIAMLDADGRPLLYEGEFADE